MKIFKHIKNKHIISGKNNCVTENISADYTINGSDNSLNISSNSFNLSKSKFVINGAHNKIIISPTAKIRGSISCIIKGSNNEVFIDENVQVVDKLNIQILKNCSNAKIYIGKHTSFWNTKIQLYDNNSSIHIGSDCMFSYNVTICNTDEHSIVQDGNLINKANDLFIGNHCWLGYDSCVMKNSYIANDTIVARAALVSGKHEQKNIILGGIPAKTIKENVNWGVVAPNDFETDSKKKVILVVETLEEFNKKVKVINKILKCYNIKSVWIMNLLSDDSNFIKRYKTKLNKKTIENWIENDKTRNYDLRFNKIDLPDLQMILFDDMKNSSNSYIDTFIKKEESFILKMNINSITNNDFEKIEKLIQYLIQNEYRFILPIAICNLK